MSFRVAHIGSALQCCEADPIVQICVWTGYPSTISEAVIHVEGERECPHICHIDCNMAGFYQDTTSVTTAAVDESNAVLRATAKVCEGDVLFVVPFDMCVTSRDLDGNALSDLLPPHDSFGRLLLALLILLEDRPEDSDLYT
jgi:hypothetical protein